MYSRMVDSLFFSPVISESVSDSFSRIRLNISASWPISSSLLTSTPSEKSPEEIFCTVSVTSLMGRVMLPARAKPSTTVASSAMKMTRMKITLLWDTNALMLERSART